MLETRTDGKVSFIREVMLETGTGLKSFYKEEKAIQRHRLEGNFYKGYKFTDIQKGQFKFYKRGIVR